MRALLGFDCNLHCFVGYFGELLVLLYLKLKSYNIIKHRYHSRFGEIYLIVAKRKRLIFVEVETNLFVREIPISGRQCLLVISASKYFLSRNPIFSSYSLRYDLYFL